MKNIFTILAAAALATAANAEPAVKELSDMAGPGQPAAAAPPPAPERLETTGPDGRRINLFPSMADMYRWYNDGSMGPYPTAGAAPPAAPPPAPGNSAPRKYRIKVAAHGDQVNVEIARSTAAASESPLISFNGGRTGNMFSGTILLGDLVQMAGYVNVQSGIQFKHSQHFTVVKIPLNNGAKFMVVTGNGITLFNSESELALANTAEAGFRVDIPIGRSTSLLRFGLTGGPGVTYSARSREGGHETTFSGTVTGNLSIINW